MNSDQQPVRAKTMRSPVGEGLDCIQLSLMRVAPATHHGLELYRIMAKNIEQEILYCRIVDYTIQNEIHCNLSYCVTEVVQYEMELGHNMTWKAVRHTICYKI